MYLGIWFIFELNWLIDSQYSVICMPDYLGLIFIQKRNEPLNQIHNLGIYLNLIFMKTMQMNEISAEALSMYVRACQIRGNWKGLRTYYLKYLSMTEIFKF